MTPRHRPFSWKNPQQEHRPHDFQHRRHDLRSGHGPADCAPDAGIFARRSRLLARSPMRSVRRRSPSRISPESAPSETSRKASSSKSCASKTADPRSAVLAPREPKQPEALSRAAAAPPAIPVENRFIDDGRSIAHVDWPCRSSALHAVRRDRGGGADQGQGRRGQAEGGISDHRRLACRARFRRRPLACRAG